MIEVRYHRGIHLPELGLWLDPHGGKELAFVSHAHADHFGRHEKVICSVETASLLRDRFGLAKKALAPLAFGEVLRRDGFRYELLPAGHIFGSAMLHLTRESDGSTLLYTGDFKLRAGRTAKVAEFRQAQTLIMETTFALPKYVFPPTEEVEADLLGFVSETLSDGELPVLFGYSLGKAQEIHAILEAHGVPVTLHPTVAKMNHACEKSGMRALPYEVFDGEVARGRALICPPNAVRSTALRKLKGKRTAMMSGWAMNPGAKYRYRTDAAFPLSDHADHPGLLESVRQVAPERVLTLHGYAREFAAELRGLGYEAWSVFGNDQMELKLERKRQAVRSCEMVRPGGGLAELTETIERIRRSTGRLRKVEWLGEYLAGLGDEELPLAARYLSGRAFGRGEDRGSFQMGAAAIRRAVCEAAGVSEARHREISARQADSARTGRLVMEEAEELQPEAMELPEVDAFLRQLARARGTVVKVSWLADRLKKLHPQEGETLLRLITGGLRIGLKSGLLEEGVAKAFGGDVSEVRRAHMLLGDVGEVATLARRDGLAEARLTPFVPVACMLASPEESAEGIAARLGQGAMWIEDKFDGIRVQVHKVGKRVELFSRDLRNMSGEFQEVLEPLSAGEGDFVIDGELIAFAEGRKLNFFDLQKRLGARASQGDLFLGQSVPVRVLAFDLLWEGGESLIDLPLRERRVRLEALSLVHEIERVKVRRESSVEAMERAFIEAKRAGNEGLIVKDPESHYSLGRRGKSWLKLKKAMPTLDCVVLKAQQGHGRRAEVLSDYTFAVRDEETDALRIIGKAYSGLTDLEIEELTEHFRQTTESKRGRVHTVRPEIVLEIAFDSIRPSKRHDSGLAMRFPRIKAIRRDKGLTDIDTLQYAQSLVDA